MPLHVEGALQRDEKYIPVPDHQLLCNVFFNFCTFILPSICDLEHKGFPLAEAWLGNGLFIFSLSGDRMVSSVLLSPTIFAKDYDHFIANRHSIVNSLELDSLRKNHAICSFRVTAIKKEKLPKSILVFCTLHSVKLDCLQEQNKSIKPYNLRSLQHSHLSDSL